MFFYAHNNSHICLFFCGRFLFGHPAFLPKSHQSIVIIGTEILKILQHSKLKKFDFWRNCAYHRLPFFVWYHVIPRPQKANLNELLRTFCSRNSHFMFVCVTKIYLSRHIKFIFVFDIYVSCDVRVEGRTWLWWFWCRWESSALDIKRCVYI